MIPFSCSSCGMKLQVGDEFAGRTGPCPTCKQSLTVPQVTKPTALPTGAISGTPSSLQQAGLDVGVTIDPPRGSLNQEDHSLVADLLAGRARTGGRYVIEKEIARGGMGAVVRAVDCDIRREVAVKYMLNDGDLAQKARFVEEAQITGQLEHPNIVPIHELGVDAERRLFFAMKIVKGRSLAQVLTELREHAATAEQKWSLSRLLTIMTNVCYALAYAHSRGVIHRDLKPANIMLGDFGETYVMDWGLAKVVGHKEPVVQEASAAPSASEFTVRTRDKAPSATVVKSPEDSVSGSQSGSQKVSTSRELEGELTQEGAVMGTPSYMAPEQARGEVQALDNRSDIYSLGAILYEMLTLHSPVEKGGGAMALLMRVANGEIKSPEVRTPDRAKAGKIPKELAAIAMKALALKPDNRYQSVEGLRHDVERFQEGRSVSAKHDTPWESAVKFVKRNKAFSAASGVGAALLTTVLAVAFNINIAARVRAEEALVLADQNFVAFEAEQKAKNEAIRNSIPGTLRAARQLANDRAVDDALKQIALVRQYEPYNPQAALLRGQILTAQRNWKEALPELVFYLQRNRTDADAVTLYNLAVTQKTDDLIVLYKAADVLRKQHLFGLTPLLLADAAQLREGKQKLFGLYQRQLAGTKGLTNLRLHENGELDLNCVNNSQVKDLTPLTGMALNIISVGNTGITDLEPLRGMPVRFLSCNSNKITTLEPLRGMPLVGLHMNGCSQISDLEPLRGMPLEQLQADGTAVTSLEPLAGMRLQELMLSSCEVGDVSPLRGMPIEVLSLYYTLVTDLEPLRGMPCRRLNLYRTRVSDLGPLAGMPCTALNLDSRANVSDVTPLKGMPCTYLNLGGTQVSDLEPLRGMPLQTLVIGNTKVTDLSPLSGMKIREIKFEPRKISQGWDVLRDMKSLASIDTGNHVHTPAEFWKRYDAGEFEKK